MRLHELSAPRGARHRRKRVGRGIGSGHGKTAGRGSKGEKARDTIRPGFEGGQTPLYMRLRKHRGRGKGAMPQRMFRAEHAIINVGHLQKVGERLGENAVISPRLLVEKRVLKKLGRGLRVLGEGEISLPVTVYANHFSASARAKIEAAGGRAFLLGRNMTAPKPERTTLNAERGTN